MPQRALLKIHSARAQQLWKNYVEPKEEVVVVDEKEREVKYKEVVVTEVVDPAHVWVQAADKAADTEKLGERLNEQLSSSPPVAGTFTPVTGGVCAAKFSDDGLWYRAKVNKINADQSVAVTFIDYGNVCRSCVSRECPPSEVLNPLTHSFAYSSYRCLCITRCLFASFIAKSWSETRAHPTNHAGGDPVCC